MTPPDRFAGAGGRRSGAILALAAVLMVAFIGLAALAVDVGVVATTRAQLRTVADAAALAGARELASDRRMSTTIANLTPEVKAARAKALEIGQANLVHGAPAQLDGADVVVGYKKTTNPNPDPADSPVNTSVNSLLYNSVQVTARYTVPSLFSGTGTTVSVTSTATVDLYQIGGFRKDLDSNTSILPIVLSKANYDAMMDGTGGDSYSFNPGGYNPPSSNGVTASIPDGAKESVAYPVKAGLAGNWGTINFGVSNNSTSILGSQIRSGMTPAQMQNEFPAGNVVAPHTFSGDPGISAGIKDDLVSIIGKPVTAPVYDLSGSNGNNAWYRVVAFTSVRIVAVDFQGKEKYVIVQPALNVDPAAIPDTGKPKDTWVGGGVVVLHLSR